MKLKKKTEIGSHFNCPKGNFQVCFHNFTNYNAEKWPKYNNIQQCYRKLYINIINIIAKNYYPVHHATSQEKRNRFAFEETESWRRLSGKNYFRAEGLTVEWREMIQKDVGGFYTMKEVHDSLHSRRSNYLAVTWTYTSQWRQIRWTGESRFKLTVGDGKVIHDKGRVLHSSSLWMDIVAPGLSYPFTYMPLKGLYKWLK